MQGIVVRTSKMRMIDPLYLSNGNTEPGVIPMNEILVSPQTAEVSTPLVALGTHKHHEKGEGMPGVKDQRNTGGK